VPVFSFCPCKAKFEMVQSEPVSVHQRFINIDDISVVRAFLSYCTELDFLRTRGGWGRRGRNHSCQQECGIM
jgi:hypothetical protein